MNKVCPGFGTTQCSDEGRRQTYKVGKKVRFRSHCTLHYSQLGKQKKLAKQIDQFHAETGIDLTKTDVITSAPPPRQLTRTSGVRASTVEHKDLMKQIRNLEHKLKDSEEKREELIQQKRSWRKRHQRLSASSSELLEQIKGEHLQIQRLKNSCEDAWDRLKKHAK